VLIRLLGASNRVLNLSGDPKLERAFADDRWATASFSWAGLPPISLFEVLPFLHAMVFASKIPSY